MSKKYFRDASTFQPIGVGFGSCIASDRITVEGAPVGLKCIGKIQIMIQIAVGGL